MRSVRNEFVMNWCIFLSPNRGRGWDLLDASGLMRAILPEIEAMKGCEQPEQFHPEGDVFKHTRLMLDFLPEKFLSRSFSPCCSTMWPNRVPQLLMKQGEFASADTIAWVRRYRGNHAAFAIFQR